MGAVLLNVEYAVRGSKYANMHCRKSFLVHPRGFGQVGYKEVEDIDFSTPKIIKKILNDIVNEEDQ